MVSYDLEMDIFQAMCATAWIMFFLILKNLVLLVVLAVQRRKNAVYRIPEDVQTFGAGQQQQVGVNDWSLAGRIQRVLANDAEYIPYFLALLIFIFCAMTLTSQSNQHYLARVLVYGLLFTIGRYLHTISYLIGNSYGRMLGFLITVIILLITSIDHVYYLTKGLHNFKPKP